MNEVLPKLTHVLAQPSLADKALESIVKSIFYGLWNFDKMINQHNLSTAIAEMLIKVPKKNAFMFLHAMLTFLKDKWNLIDHHRINKFMQLVRYLIRQSLKVSQKKTDEGLLQTIYNNLTHSNTLIIQSRESQTTLLKYILTVLAKCSCPSLKQTQPIINPFLGRGCKYLKRYYN